MVAAASASGGSACARLGADQVSRDFHGREAGFGARLGNPVAIGPLAPIHGLRWLQTPSSRARDPRRAEAGARRRDLAVGLAAVLFFALCARCIVSWRLCGARGRGLGGARCVSTTARRGGRGFARRADASINQLLWNIN
jgi:hypothetical protein